MPSAVRRAVPVLALAAAAALAGCASDDVAGPEAPEASRPAELVEMRETLADRREATRDLMETNLIRPSRTGAGEPSTWGSDVLGFFGRATDATLDALTLRALGLW